MMNKICPDCKRTTTESPVFHGLLFCPTNPNDCEVISKMSKQDLDRLYYESILNPRKGSNKEVRRRFGLDHKESVTPSDKTSPMPSKQVLDRKEWKKVFLNTLTTNLDISQQFAEEIFMAHEEAGIDYEIEDDPEEYAWSNEICYWRE